MLSGILSISVSASSQPLFVNFGDSIAWGRIEDEDNYPEYDWEEDSYSGLFASYLGTVRTSYARRGMQTTDILYMIDEEFRNDVDSGKIEIDSWHQSEYPPYDGVSLEQVCTDTENADYIALNVGIVDFISYPGELKSISESSLADVSEAEAFIEECAFNGKLDLEACEALEEVLDERSEEALIILNYISDILDGYADYLEYYSRIVKDLREMNEDAEIILLGIYLPGSIGLAENDEDDTLYRTINHIIDKVNFVVKEAALTYNCLYVETMGVDSNWHPTVKGHQQICDRMISVHEGNSKYAGGIVTPSIYKISTGISKIVKETNKYLGKLRKIFNY